MADQERLTKAEQKALRKAERTHWEQQMDKAQKSSNMKKIGMWLAGAVVVLLAVWGLYALVTAPGPDQQSLAATMPQLTSTDISRGPKNAKVTMVEYADFQCPACGAYYPLIKQLYKDYDGKVQFVYRFFPLTAIHRNAMQSAEAGYAAYKQGKFWEMEDVLFTNQNTWAESTDPMPTFLSYAKQLGLNTDQFTADMQAQSTKDFIQKEEDAGTNAGVNATPTFFINGKQIQNPSGYSEFKQLIDQQLK